MTDTVIRKANHVDAGFQAGVPFQKQLAVVNSKCEIHVVVLDTETEIMVEAQEVFNKSKIPEVNRTLNEGKPTATKVTPIAKVSPAKNIPGSNAKVV